MRIEGRQSSGDKKPEKCEISISNVRAGQITLLVKVGGKQRGYPNLGIADEFDLEPVQCILCGWTDEWDREEDADEIRPSPDPEYPLDWEWPNWGYSLTNARGNFEKSGAMFRPEDPCAKTFARAAPLRRRLKRLLDEIMADIPDRREDKWATVEQLGWNIINASATALSVTNSASQQVPLSQRKRY